MGTEARVVLYGCSEPEAAHAAGLAFDEIERLEQVLSDYRPKSEVRVFQSSAAVGAWTRVSPTLLEAFEQGLELGRQTDGAFSIAVGPAVQLWRAARKNGGIPSESAIVEAQEASRARNLRVDPRTLRAKMLVPGMKFDFGGIGKGLAAEAARGVLTAAGFPVCLVELGGDLAVGEAPPGKPGWSIRIDTGHAESESRILVNTCIATSGDSAQWLVLDGMRYSHILDPRTGRALSTRRSATVVHPDGATADAVASAACVLGRRGIRPVQKRFPMAVVSIIEDHAE